MYRSFRSNKKFLTRHHTLYGAVYLLGCAIAVGVHRSEWSASASHALGSVVVFLPAIFLLSSADIRLVAVSFVAAISAFFASGLNVSWTLLPCLALSPIFALVATGVLHNASHGNFKTAWLNRIVGEAAATVQFVSFPDWVIVHVIHHSHPDDPDRDPHPPAGLTYWQFLMGMRKSILKVLFNEYIGHFGAEPNSLRELRRLALVSRIEQFARSLFFFVLLGPFLFTWFLVPSLLFKMLHYAWFNYATHKERNGQRRIVNLTTGLYSLVNFLSFGLYYHENHHLNPKLFNPSRRRETGSKRT